MQLALQWLTAFNASKYSFVIANKIKELFLRQRTSEQNSAPFHKAVNLHFLPSEFWRGLKELTDIAIWLNANLYSCGRLTIIQVQLVQFLRFSLDHYRNRGQIMITVLMQLWQWQWLVCWRLISLNLRQLVLLLTHYGWVSWTAGLQIGWLLGNRWNWRRGTVGIECLLVTKGTATAQMLTHLRLQHDERWLLWRTWVHNYRPWHFLYGGDTASGLLKS